MVGSTTTWMSAVAGGVPVIRTRSTPATRRRVGFPGSATGATDSAASSTAAQVTAGPTATRARRPPSPRSSSSTSQVKAMVGTPTPARCCRTPPGSLARSRTRGGGSARAPSSGPALAVAWTSQAPPPSASREANRRPVSSRTTWISRRAPTTNGIRSDTLVRTVAVSPAAPRKVVRYTAAGAISTPPTVWLPG